MQNSIVRFETAFGDIRVKLELEKAKLTARNFIWYLEQGYYQGATFYRTVHPQNQPNQTVKIDVIQGGLGMEDHPNKRLPIPHQTTLETGLKHLSGTISMSRLAPGSANSEFFFCIGDQPELDFGGKRNPDGQGFAAFGQTVSGFDVLQQIWKQPEENQMLLKPVVIHQVLLEQ